MDTSQQCQRKSQRNSQSRIAAANTEAVESIATSLVTTQFEIMRAMSQCAIAWWSMPITAWTSIANAQQANDHQTSALEAVEAAPQAPSASPQIATSPNITWPVAPILPSVAFISGLEDTLHDQFFEPRPDEISTEAPDETQKTDITTLWARSNEFEAGPQLVHISQPDDHHAA